MVLNRLWGLGTSLCFPVGWILPDSQVFKILTTPVMIKSTLLLLLFVCFFNKILEYFNL